MNCTCSPALLLPENENKRYAQQLLLELPDGPERSRRIAAGLSSKVCVDPCIETVIVELWRNGIETLGCCCGHNSFPAYVDVDEKDFNKMLTLGYEKMPINEHGHCVNSFFIK